MASSNEQVPVEPMFDTAQVGRSLEQMFPARREYLQGIRLGDILAPNIGSGLEIDGIRQHVPGDDRRHINQRATARNPEGTELQQLHFADITPSLWIVTDVLQSRYEANAVYFSKRLLGLSAIMSMVKMANYQGMPVGIVAATDRRVDADKAAAGGRHQSLHIGHKLGDLLSEQLGQDTDEKHIYLSDALSRAAKLATLSAVVVVSGFRDVYGPKDNEHGWSASFQRLVKAGNDVTSIELTQPYNEAMPKQVSVFRLLGKRTINISGRYEKRLREHYQELSAQQQAVIDAELSRRHVAHVELTTSNPAWHSNLRQQLRRIGKMRANS